MYNTIGILLCILRLCCSKLESGKYWNHISTYKVDFKKMSAICPCLITESNSYFSGYRPSFWNGRSTCSNGSNFSTNASFMFYTKFEIPFSDFNACKHSTNARIGINVFLLITRATSNMGKESIR